jgi:tetratricopeptide (TPR) repeat protein
MRPVLWGLLIFVLCLPLAFVLWLVAAAKYPAMDSFTMTLPADVRATVAELTMRNAGYGKDSAKAIDRTIVLDPDNTDAWSRRCQGNFQKIKGDIASCRKAIALDPSAFNYNGLGLAQEDAKDFCAAEDSYTTALRTLQNDANLLRNMARAALRCGHAPASVAGFEVAEDLDAKAATDPSQDDSDDAKSDLVTDREYLTVAYDRTNQPAKAATTCAKAHATWKTCHCELTDSAVKCSDTSTPPASKK